MTCPLTDCTYCAQAAAIWESQANADDTPPWDEGREQRIDQIAQTIDEDGRYRALGPRRDRP